MRFLLLTVTSNAARHLVMALWLIFLLFSFSTASAQILEKVKLTQNDQGQYGGTTTIETFGTELTFFAPLVTEKEDVQFEAQVSNEVTIQNVLVGLGGQNLYDELNKPPFTGLLDILTIPSSTITIHPFSKTVSLLSENPLGNVEFEVKKREEYTLFTLAYSPTATFKLSSIDNSLSALDDFNIVEGYQIAISNDTDQRPDGTKPPFEMRMEGTIDKAKLLGEIKSLLDPDNQHPEINNFINQIPTLTLSGALNSNYDSEIAASSQINFDVGKGWKFEELGMSASIVKGAPFIVTVDGKGIIPVDGTNLRLTLGMSAEPPTAAGFTFDLVSLDPQGNQQEWYEPYGVPYIAFNHIGGDIRGDAATLIDNLSFRGNLLLGKKTASVENETRITGEMDISLDADPMQNAYYSTFTSLNLLDLVTAFEPTIDLPEEMKSILDIGVEKSEFQLDPKAKQASIAGEIAFFDYLEAGLDVRISPEEGAKIGGRVEPIAFSPAGIELFSLNSTDNSGEGAFFDIDINPLDPKISIDGEVKVLGLSGSHSDIEINKNGLVASVGMDFLALGKGELTIAGRDFTRTGQIKLTGHMKPAMSNLTDEISQFVSDQAGSVVGGFVDGILNEVFKLDDIEIDAAIDNWSTGFNLKVHYTALFGEEVLEVPVNFDFASSPENIGITVASIVAALGEELIEVAGNRVETIVFDAPIEVLNELLVVSDSNDPVEQSLISILNAPTQGMIDAFDFLSGSVKNKTFEKPNKTTVGPISSIPPGFRHFSVDFQSIYVSSADEDNGDDVFGHIYFPQTDQKLMFMPPGTNQTFLGLNEDEEKTGLRSGNSVPTTPHKKHVYVSQRHTFLDLIATLYEEDDWPDGDDELRLKKVSKGASIITVDSLEIARIDLSSFPPDQTIPQYYAFTYKEGKSRWIVNFSITPDQMITGERLLADIRAGEDGFDVFVQNLKKGGDLGAIKDQALVQALSSQNKQVLDLLLGANYGLKINSQHLDIVCSADSLFDEAMIKLAVDHLDPSQKPSANHINFVLRNSSEWLANLMMSKGGSPDHQSLQLCLQKKYYTTASEIILSHKVTPTVEDLNSAISRRDGFAFNIVFPHVMPDHSSFEKAASANDIRIFQRLHAKGPEIIMNTTPAKTAVDNDNMAIFRLCLNKTVTPDSIVVYTVSKQHTNALEYCLAQGADLKRPLLKAIEKSDAELSTLILGSDSTQNALLTQDSDYLRAAVIYSKKSSHLEIVKMLLERGANTNGYVDEKTGNTLLHIASMKGRPTPAITDVMGQEMPRPWYQKLFIRTKREHAVMETLISHGADVNVGNHKGLTPLHLAANRARKERDVELVKMMVETEGNVNACSQKGKSVYKVSDGKLVRKYLTSQGAEKKACKS